MGIYIYVNNYKKIARFTLPILLYPLLSRNFDVRNHSFHDLSHWCCWFIQTFFSQIATLIVMLWKFGLCAHWFWFLSNIAHQIDEGCCRAVQNPPAYLMEVEIDTFVRCPSAVCCCLGWRQGLPALIDSFTVSLHSPDGRQFACRQGRSRDCQWPLKIVGIPTDHLSPPCIAA